MRIITPDFKLVGLLGNPLGQSVSAAAHNAVYAKKDWNYYYIPIEIKACSKSMDVKIDITCVCIRNDLPFRIGIRLGFFHVEAADDDVGVGAEQRAGKGLFEGGLADHVGPQTQTIHELPVVDEVNAGGHKENGRKVLLLRHGRRGVANVDGELANIHEGVLVGGDGIHGVELGYAVTHYGERLVGGF